jgi:general secretion pathway protein E
VVLAATPAQGAVGAIGAFRRLVPDRFAFAAALRLVAASSTARHLCQQCREPVQAYGTLSAKLGFDSGAIIYSAAGCAACGETGESGEFRIYEVIELDSAMRRLTYESGDESLLARHAFLNAPDLGAAARNWAREGAISAEEAVRVSRSSRPVTMMLG